MQRHLIELAIVAVAWLCARGRADIAWLCTAAMGMHTPCRDSVLHVMHAGRCRLTLLGGALSELILQPHRPHTCRCNRQAMLCAQ